MLHYQGRWDDLFLDDGWLKLGYWHIQGSFMGCSVCAESYDDCNPLQQKKRKSASSKNGYMLNLDINIHKLGDKGTMADVAYCVKCKEKRDMNDAHQITMRNGKPALQGTCTVCGTKLTRILSSQKA
ncbi:hypothetical protein ccbrp13_06630 [Ktedonobacteria bacterium brp13]|nr:hypothetical protein ccbrp13_06630 [Ktedonobacteria bacterium brp13]